MADHYSGPSIDHSLLSPSGRVSKRTREAALRRESERFWNSDYGKGLTADLAASKSAREAKYAAEKPARLRKQADFLQRLAEGGMKPRAYRKEAERLRAEADEIERKPNPLFGLRRPKRKEVTLNEVRELQEEESESLCRHHDFDKAKRALRQRPKAYARARGLRIEDQDRTADRDQLLKRLIDKGNMAAARAVASGGLRKANPFPPGKDFMREVIKRPGALHRKLGVPEGEDIPHALIEEAIAHPERFERTHAAQERLKREAVLARTMEGWQHGRRNPLSESEKLLDDAEGIQAQAERKNTKAAWRQAATTWEVIANYFKNRSNVPLSQHYAARARSAYENAKYRRNPEAEIDRDSANLYDQFHGRGPNRIGVYNVPVGIPASVAELGALLKIKIVGKGRMLQQLTWEPSEGVKLAADPGSDSLYIIGERQRLPANCLENLEDEFGDAARKDQFILGTIKEITYRTQKGFDKFETIDYYHELGEETGERPLLVYDRRNHRLLIVGGAYTVKPEGITN